MVANDVTYSCDSELQRELLKLSRDLTASALNYTPLPLLESTQLRFALAVITKLLRHSDL